MSSNIRISKVCEYCENEYEAKTLYTRYCSHGCNRRGYKALKRKEKLLSANSSPKVNKVISKVAYSLDFQTIHNKEFLTINEACAILNITSVTIRRWIKNNILNTKRIGKKHIILRSEIELRLK